MEYSRLKEIRSLYTAACVLALTASGPPLIRETICSSLAMKDTRLVVDSSNRPNIFYMCHKAPSSVENTFAWLTEELLTHRQTTRKYIIYCRSIVACSVVYKYFVDQLGDNAYIGIPSFRNRLFALFHHSTNKRIKQYLMNTFNKPDSPVRVVIATIAFGMGIDVPDVFMVIHWGASRSLWACWQRPINDSI